MSDEFKIVQQNDIFMKCHQFHNLQQSDNFIVYK